MRGYFFIIDAMVILPYLKIDHEKKDIFGKFTMQMRNFGKFTVSFWKIYNEKKQISMEIGIMGKFPWIYGTMP
jgi:hypothetical protein